MKMESGVRSQESGVRSKESGTKGKRQGSGMDRMVFDQWSMVNGQ